LPDVPAVLPTSLIAGDTWLWDRDYSDYPRPTWTATAYFEKADQTFSVDSSANGTAQRFTVAASTTASYSSGRYRIRVRVTDGSSTYVAESGWVDVELDPAKAGKQDPRSWARRTLDAVEAFLEGNATTAQQSMSLAGRSISRWSLSELMQFRDQLRGEVRTQEQASSAGIGRDIRVRLGRG
jgi:hypothetical protein